MNKINEKYLFSDITSLVLQAYYKVYNKVGYGFSQEIYKKALLSEFKNLKLKHEYNKKISINYEGIEVGKVESDFVVKNTIIVTIKSEKELNSENSEQLKSLLKSSVYEVGLLLNFGRIPEHKRIVFTNNI